MASSYHCGLITLLGRPNVGKSTLMNKLVGQKISITSERPQTTRHRIVGIKSGKEAQFIFVDTPGLHRKTGKAMNRLMNKTARGSLIGIDCVIFIVTANGWCEEDAVVLNALQEIKVPVILAINKIDRLKDRKVLLPLIEESTKKMGFVEIVPLSAKTGENIDKLEMVLARYIPEQSALYPVEQLTDRSDRFLAAELLREKVFRNISQEVPYAVTAVIDKFEADDNGVLHIDAIIWVEKAGQKAIIIGKHGRQLKTIGSQARQEMEKLFHRKVFLQLWVKVQKGWSDSEQALQQFGYNAED